MLKGMRLSSQVAAWEIPVGHKKFFIMGVVMREVPREVVRSPSLKIFKNSAVQGLE